MKIFNKLFFFIFLLFCFSTAISQNTLSYTQNESEYNEGIEKFQKKAYVAARKHFQNYVELAQKDITPNYYTIANAKYYAAVAGLYTNALDADIEVERFVTDYAEHPKAKLIYSELANNYFENGEYEKAIEYFGKAIAYRQGSAELYNDRYKLGVAYYKLKDFKNALIEFDYVKNTNATNSLDAAYYAAVINFSKENYEEAVVDLKKIENVNPYKVEVPNWLAQIYYKQKKYNELVAYAEPVIANPNGRKIDEVALLLAEVYFFQNKFDKAAIYYEKYKQFHRSGITPQVIFRHGYSLYKLQDFKKSAEILKQIANQKDAIGQQAAYYLGISSLQAKELNAASIAFNLAQSQNHIPEIKEEAMYNYMKVLIEQGNTAEATNQLKQYLAQFPSGKYVDDSNELLSDILFDNNNYKAAIEYIESLTRKSSKINEAYQQLTFNQGIVEFNSEKFQNAISYFKKSIATPTNANLVLLAKLWKAESSYALELPESESLYKELINSSNEEVRLKSQYSLGYLFYNQKEYTKSSSYFKDFLQNSKGKKEFISNYEDALIRLADCYLIQKNYNQALKLYDEAIASNRVERDYALYQKANTLQFMGKNEEAARILKQLTSTYPNSRLIDDALFEQGKLELDNGNYQSAVNTLSEILKKRPNTTLAPKILVKRALAFSNLSKTESAISDYKVIIRKFPKTEEAEEAIIGLKELLNTVNRNDEYIAILEEYQNANPSNTSVTSLQFDAAKNMYYSEKYDQAIAALKKYVATYPTSSNVPEAKYFIADSYLMLSDTQNALSFFKNVVEDNQTSYVSQAAYKIASISYEKREFNDAIKYYTIVTEASANKREIVSAWQGLYQSYFEIGQYAQAIKYCNETINNGGNILLNSTNKAQLTIGKCYQKQALFQNAVTEFNKVVAMAKDENAAEAKYRIGEVAYQQKNYDESIKLLQIVGSEYSDFMVWYEKAFLLIARNYVAKKDDFMAKATLNSIIENSTNAETVKEAKEILKSI